MKGKKIIKKRGGVEKFVAAPPLYNYFRKTHRKILIS